MDMERNKVGLRWKEEQGLCEDTTDSLLFCEVVVLS